MTYAIISDTTLDLNDKLKNLHNITFVPFKLYLEDKEFIDNRGDYSDVMDFMKDYNGIIDSKCPTPQQYLDAIYKSGADEVFILTASKSLSNSYKNAEMAAAELIDEEGYNIHVIDTVGASSQATLVFLKLVELINDNLSFFEIVKNIEFYILNTRAFSVTEDVDYMIEHGIMDDIDSPFSGVIRVNPILKQDRKGEIIVEKIAIGRIGLIQEIIDIINEYSINNKNCKIVISHNKSDKLAFDIESKLREELKFNEVYIVDMNMLVSSYLNHRGIVIAFEII